MLHLIYLNIHSHIEATIFSYRRAHYRALQRLKRKVVKKNKHSVFVSPQNTSVFDEQH